MDVDHGPLAGPETAGHSIDSERVEPPVPAVSLGTASRFWLQLGFISFGGPAGQIAILHRELVERRRWIAETNFLDALNCCMLLPGPEAQQLATYIGWRLHGVRGGLIAGTLFLLPSAFLLAALSWIYARHGDLLGVAAVLDGVRPAVVAIVAAALVRVGRKSLRGALSIGIAVGAFLALRFFHLPFPLIVLAAGILAAVVDAAPTLSPRPTGDSHKGRGGSDHASPPGASRDTVRPDHRPATEAGAALRPRHLRHTAAVLLTGVALWLAGYGVLGAWRGWDGIHSQLYRFFSQTAVMTLGGAYSVLTYVAETLGPERGWVTASQTIDGLALAETTPGPLIMVLQFLGYMAGWNHSESAQLAGAQPGDLAPAASGLLGAAVATYTTFLPSFVFVFLIAPHVERLRNQRRLRAALAGVSAAVLGGIAHLAAMFAAATFFPAGSVITFQGFPLVSAGLALAAFALLMRTSISVGWVVAGAGFAGWLLFFLRGGL